MHELGGVGAYVAEALHDHAAALARQAEFLDGLVAHHHHAAAGGFAASARSADVDGLSGHARGHGLAHVHGVGIHHPGHDLFVGVDVGGGNIFFGADEFDQFRGVAPGHALDFAHRHLVRIADHATLGAAERDVDHGALPGHPTGQGAHFVECDVGSVTNAAFARTARNGMLHAEAGENFQMPVVHLHRDIHRELTVGITQHPPQALIEVEFLSGQIKAGALGLPRIALFIHVRVRRHRRHRNFSGINAGRCECRSVLAVAGQFPAGGGQTFRVYEGGWPGSKKPGNQKRHAAAKRPRWILKADV